MRWSSFGEFNKTIGEKSRPDERGHLDHCSKYAAFYARETVNSTLDFTPSQVKSLAIAFFFFFLYPGHHNNHSKNGRSNDDVVLDLFEKHGDYYS